MKKSISYIIVSLLMGSAFDSAGQMDTLFTFPTVEIQAAKIRQLPIGSPIQQWTSKELTKIPATHIGELLSTEAGSYIKSYGLGSLATSSIRGGSAGHTLVLWNGLPIQSPMLGLLDLSLLPINAVETITFQKGGNTALWGSGAIGGVIGLDGAAKFDQKFSIENQTVGGNFGYFQQTGKLVVGNERFQSQTKLNYQKATNDFFYLVGPNLPQRQQTNANFSKRNILQDFYWEIGANQQLDIHFWRQDARQSIPPTTVQTRSVAFQEDWSNRSIIHWQYNTQKAVWSVKTGLFDEYQDFTDELTALFAHNHFRSFFGEITRSWQWKQAHQILIGSTHTHTRAWSKGYADSPTENKTAAFASWKWTQPKWQLQASIRQELVDGNFIPLVPVLGINYQLAPILQLQFKISRNYRLPTLNDRFWQPGGNVSLAPESGWSQELGVATTYQQGNWQFKGSITAFNRHIDNWILWSIQQGEVFWSANNLTKVWSRGLEPRVEYTYQSNNYKIQLNGGYDYIRSTNQVALELPRIGKGEQLIYTPRHQAFGKLAIDWQQVYIAYQHQFVGATQGINESIEAYQVGNVCLQYQAFSTPLRTTFFLTVSNLWNADYQVIERRPMPGSHYQIGIQFNTFKK